MVIGFHNHCRGKGGRDETNKQDYEHDFRFIAYVCMMRGMKAMAASERLVELKYGSQYPPTHSYSVADMNWMQKIEKETNGRVKIKPYWSGTLIGNMGNVAEVEKRTVDIGFITPVFEDSGVDLTVAAIGYFWGSPSDKLNIKIYWELWDKFPELCKEIDRLKVLALTAATPLRLMTVKPVRTLADLKGMRIKTSGDMVAPLNVFGAEGLGISMAEAVEGMKKGTIDGVFCNVDGYKSMELAEIVKYETENFFSTRGPSGARGMNWSTWNKLPPDTQKVFEGNKEWWSFEIVNTMEKGDIEGRELSKKAGVQIIQMPASEVQRLSDVHKAENIKMARELDGKGLPATKLYNEVRRLLKLYSGATNGCL